MAAVAGNRLFGAMMQEIVFQEGALALSSI